MPRFYFDVRQDGRLTADTEGEELADNAAAEREATLVASHLTKELLSCGRGNLAVEVRDKIGKPVVRATVSLDVEHP